MNNPVPISSTRLSISAWGIIMASVLFRMIGLNRPLLGNFSMYQTANAMMARFFIENHFTNLFYPQVNVLVDGKPGLLLLAYPLNALIAAGLTTALGGSLDRWGRLQAILFFAGTAIYLYRLCALLLDKRLAFASLLVFSLSPLTIIYGQSFQNEMLTLFFSVTFLFYGILFLRNARPANLILSAFSLSLVLITRPNNLFLLLPAGYFCFFDPEAPAGISRRFLRALATLALASLIPGLWYAHLWKVSHEASNIYSTLFSQLEVRSSFLSPIIFTLSYYQKLFDALSGIVLTPLGFTLFLFGVPMALQDFKRYGFFILWCIGFWATSLLIPRKLIDHDFYLLHFLIAAAPMITLAGRKLFDSLELFKSGRKILVPLFLWLSFLISLRYALHPAFKTSQEDRYLLNVAEDLRRVTEKNASKIIVQGSHPVLYYADRYGWTFNLRNPLKISDYYTQTNWEKLPKDQWKKRNKAFEYPISEVEYRRLNEGATHFIVMNPEEFYRFPKFAAYMFEHFETAYGKDNNMPLIFKLR